MRSGVGPHLAKPASFWRKMMTVPWRALMFISALQHRVVCCTKGLQVKSHVAQSAHHAIWCAVKIQFLMKATNGTCIVVGVSKNLLLVKYVIYVVAIHRVFCGNSQGILWQLTGYFVATHRVFCGNSQGILW